MEAKAGDACCFCGEKLMFNGERVLCVSRDDDDPASPICIGYVRPQEEPPADVKLYRKVGHAVLDNLLDRRGVHLPKMTDFCRERLTWEVGQAAVEAMPKSRRTPGTGGEG